MGSFMGHWPFRKYLPSPCMSSFTVCRVSICSSMTVSFIFREIFSGAPRAPTLLHFLSFAFTGLFLNLFFPVLTLPCGFLLLYKFSERSQMWCWCASQCLVVGPLRSWQQPDDIGSIWYRTAHVLFLTQSSFRFNLFNLLCLWTQTLNTASITFSFLSIVRCLLTCLQCI